MERKRIKKLLMKNIYKEFPGVIANNNVNLEIHSGEILGLLGENGAGKTTLMKILYGLYTMDNGEIFINDSKVKIHSPRDSIRYGIGMVHQHFMLIEPHTVAENVALGLENLPFNNPGKYVKEQLEDFYKKYGLKVNPDSFIWQLSAGEQQRVEIIKALFRGADLLILDEPTSVLTPQEAEELFDILRNLKDEGHSVIFITHKLEEVKAITDRVVVLRKGEVVGEAITSKTTQKELAQMMVGREVIFHIEKKFLEKGNVILEVENLKVKDDRGLDAVKDLSFKIYSNEILGIAGVAGNGQRELVEAITGLRKIESGKVIINGKDVTNKSVKEIYKNGLAHVPEERMKYPIVPDFPLFENTIIKNYDDEKFKKGIFFDFNKIKDYTNEIVEKFNVSTPSVEKSIKFLSGGNIQKFILGREIMDNPKIIVAAHPTYGLDVGATEFIRKQLLKIREKGGAVLLVSEDLEEIFELSDRIAVMYEGEFMGIVEIKDANIEDIGLMMAGSKRLNKQGEK